MPLPCEVLHFSAVQHYSFLQQEVVNFQTLRCTYLNGTRTGTCASDELAGACIIRVHAKSASRARTACLGHAALNVGGITGAIAGQIEALGGAA